MLGDPLSGRFITADNKPDHRRFAGWRNAAIMAGHWALYGVGMFVVEERQTGRICRTRRPLDAAGLAGF